ncbi:MAG: fibronectin type III domain-containing protein [Sulfuricella sp.]
MSAFISCRTQTTRTIRWSIAIAMAMINLLMLPTTAIAESKVLNLPLAIPQPHWAPPIRPVGKPVSLAAVSLAAASLAFYEEQNAIAQINLRRTQVGLAALPDNSTIDTAARGHSTYLAVNNLTGHFQTPGTPSFTGANPGARLTAAGYPYTRFDEVGATGPFSGVQAVEDIITAIYHRFGLFDSRVDEFGVGMDLSAAQGRLTADLATRLTPPPSVPNWIGVYPYDGETGVPRDFLSDTESPDPVASLNRVGFPVSLHVDGTRTLSVTSFTVTPAGGTALNSQLLSSTADLSGHTPAFAAAAIPLTVLDYGTTYQASFTGAVDGASLSKVWQFTTVAYVPLLISGPTTANIGDTITLKFSGGSGVYSNVAWPRYEAAVSAQQWLAGDTYQFTVNSAGTNQLLLTDSENHQTTLQFTVASSGLPVTLTGPTTLYVGDSPTWTFSGGTYRYTNVGWNNSAVLGSPTWPSTNSVGFTATGVGTATITVTDSAGVSGTITVNVQSAAATTSTTTSAPTIGTAIAGNAQATVSFTAPTNTGGSPITGYSVISSPAGGVDTNAGTTALTHTITGLTNGTSYTFMVVAANSVGAGTASAASNSVIPSKGSQSIGAISFLPTSLSVGGITTASATATSSLAVSYSSTTPAVCAASGSTVTGVTAGACTIAANQAGNASYNAAAQVTQTITVGQASQSISFGTAPTVVVGGTGTVSATGGASGNAVTFSSTTIGICTVSGANGSTVTGVTAGNCIIAANQAGNANYNAATQVTQNITIGNTLPTAPVVNLAPGWNLVGNGMNTPISASSVFGNPANVTTVWKWEPTGVTAGITYPAWAFYAPSLADGGAAYAASKSYDFLTTINPGEGFWVNAKSVFTAPLPSGTPISTSSFQDQLVPPNQLSSGWSLIAVGDNPTASAFNIDIGATPPATGVIPSNLISLWAWDSASSNWYFYAPTLDSNGALANYITTKGYLNFGTKPLDPTMGFWVNHP